MHKQGDEAKASRKIDDDLLELEAFLSSISGDLEGIDEGGRALVTPLLSRPATTLVASVSVDSGETEPAPLSVTDANRVDRPYPSEDKGEERVADAPPGDSPAGDQNEEDTHQPTPDSSKTKRRQERRKATAAKRTIKKKRVMPKKTRKQSKSSPHRSALSNVSSPALQASSEANKENIDCNGSANVDAALVSVKSEKHSTDELGTSKPVRTALTVRRRSQESSVALSSRSRARTRGKVFNGNDGDDDDSVKSDADDMDYAEWQEERQSAKRAKKSSLFAVRSPAPLEDRSLSKRKTPVRSASTLDDLDTAEQHEHPAQEDGPRSRASKRLTDRSSTRRRLSDSSPAWHSSPMPSQAWELSPTSHPSSSSASSTGDKAHRAPYSPPPHSLDSQALLLRSWDCGECGTSGNYASRFECRVCQALNPLRKSTPIYKAREGDVVHGTVMNVVPFGVFVDIGSAVHGFLPTGEAQLARPGIARGDKIFAKVVRIKRGSKLQIALSMTMVDQQTGRELAFAPEAGSTHTGVVTSVHRYGSFVAIPGFGKQGLLGVKHNVRCGDRVHVRVANIRNVDGVPNRYYLDRVQDDGQTTVGAAQVLNCGADWTSGSTSSFASASATSYESIIANGNTTCLSCGSGVHSQYRFCPYCGGTVSSYASMQAALAQPSTKGYPASSFYPSPYAMQAALPHAVVDASRYPPPSPYVPPSPYPFHAGQQQPQQSQLQHHADDAVLNMTLESLQLMWLDRDTLVQWYKTSADQFEAILPGFLVRVKGSGDQYAIGRIAACQQDKTYSHNLLGSLTCSKSLLVRVSGEADLKSYPLYMASSQPFTREEFDAYQLRVAINPDEALMSPSDLQQKLRIKKVMLDRLLQ